MFKQNVGTLDRSLRIAVGVVLIALAFIGPQSPWGLVGIIPLATGVFGTCPIYSLLGINSCARSG